MQFSHLLTTSYRGVKGITEIDSGKQGLTAGIFAITHGNEPVGLYVMDTLITYLRRNITCGKVLFIAVNIEAYQLYLSSDDPTMYRMIDHNMNRISNQSHQENSHEFERLKELYPVLEEIDTALDLHSTTQGGCTMGITDTTLLEETQEFMNTDILLSDAITDSGALIAPLLKRGKKAYGIECGQHTNPETITVGVLNSINFLKYYGLLPGMNKKHDSKPVYRFCEEIIPVSSNFRFVKQFSPFETVVPNQPYAFDDTIIYKNTYSNNRCIGLLGTTIVPGDGIGFLFEKIS